MHVDCAYRTARQGLAPSHRPTRNIRPVGVTSNNVCRTVLAAHAAEARDLRKERTHEICHHLRSDQHPIAHRVNWSGCRQPSRLERSNPTIACHGDSSPYGTAYNTRPFPYGTTQSELRKRDGPQYTGQRRCGAWLRLQSDGAGRNGLCGATATEFTQYRERFAVRCRLFPSTLSELDTRFVRRRWTRRFRRAARDSAR